MVNVIKIENLSKSFGNHTVLQDINVILNKGENLVVFGRSGSGKSVLLKCIIGLMVPDRGRVAVFDKPVNGISHDELNEIRKRIGFLFQGGALYDSMSVRENLEFMLIKNFNYSDEELESKVKTALERVGLLEAIDKMPAELSGGMKKRIALARSIITEPELMLYDEPTTGLDPITSKEISSLIRDLQKDLNMTSVVVTHDLICARLIEDRTIVLRDGKIQHEGSLDELTASDDPFLKNFFSNEVIDEH